MEIIAPKIQPKRKGRQFPLWAEPKLLDEFLAIAKESGTTGTFLLTRFMKEYINKKGGSDV